MGPEACLSLWKDGPEQGEHTALGLWGQKLEGGSSELRMNRNILLQGKRTTERK